ncbi:hypothetical protein QAD02_005689 [Eretmocerus hayati]|uniref:Uncharacterized protein n=1 Tax=Eretmocerus hayati TaxID=131215 RepID=A0ACC2NW35_9HYME|nr:hypothetical protein QAD02_005689 [Eretmocerus hayati]
MGSPEKLELTSDFIRKGVEIPWHIKEWSYFRQYERVVRIGKIAPRNLSCSFDLYLDVNSDDDEDLYDSEYSPTSFEVKLHHGQGPKSKFRVKLFLEKVDHSRYDLGMRSVVMIANDDRLLRFSLPALKNINEYKLRKFSGCYRPEVLDSFVKDNVLTITVSIEEIIELRHIVDELRINEDEVQEEVKRNQDLVIPVEKFIESYEQKRLCDVIFLVGPNVHQAHSLVLATVSPFFRSLLMEKNWKKEYVLDCHAIKIDLREDKHIDSEIFGKFLDCLHGSKKTDELRHIAEELIVLSNKFEVDELRRACEIHLCESLNGGNFARLLLFAHENNCQLLKSKACALAPSFQHYPPEIPYYSMKFNLSD